MTNKLAFKVDKVPNALTGAQQFLDLSQEYLELVPRLSRQSLPIGNSIGSRTTKRVAALAVVMQRKFVQNGENTYLPGLLDNILREHKRDINKNLKKKLRRFQDELSHAIKGLHEAGTVYESAESQLKKSTALIVPEILYGRLVHSDYKKWKAGGSHPWFVASSSFLVAQDSFRQYIEQMRGCLIELSDLGILRGLQYEVEVTEDRLSPDGAIEL